MGNDELLNYISMFREKAEQGKLVIFVGAGVSCNVDGMPSWNALIQNMAKAIDYSRCDTCRHRLESCENTCLLKDDFSTDEALYRLLRLFFKKSERTHSAAPPFQAANAPLVCGLMRWGFGLVHLFRQHSSLTLLIYPNSVLFYCFVVKS